MGLDDFEAICTEAMKIPKIFKKMLFERIKQAEKVEADKIPKQTIVSYYKRECEAVEVQRRVFNLLA